MTLKHLLAPSVMALSLSLAACNNSATDAVKETTAEIEAVAAKPVLGSFGIATENMDKSVKPGDNFFKYVNGTWLKNTEIPADKSSYGAFTTLRDLSDERVKVIIEEAAAKDAPDGSEEQKIGDFYAAFGWVDVDVKDVDNYIFYLTQSGLGMPNRDYYLDEGEKSDELRAAYVKYLRAMLTAADDENPLGSARKIMAFETAMARSHWTNTKRRNRSLTYNKMSLDELKAYAPGFPWDSMLEASGISDQKTFVVRENDAIKGLAKTFGATDLETIKAYMTANYVGSMAAYLPAKIDNARFDFYGKALRGTEVQQERWKRAVNQIDGTMGEMVGKVYVEKHFPPVER